MMRIPIITDHRVRLFGVQTNTHALIGLAGFWRRPLRGSGWASVVGAVLPDAFIGALLAVSRAKKIPNKQIWSEEYFKEPWVTRGAISNSVPLWSALLLGGTILKVVHPKTGELVTIAAKSGLSHLAIDFATHADDAHQHFWPISDWQFNSPVSYWDVRHHANYVMPVEGAIGLAAIKSLWPKTTSILQRGGLVLFGAASTALVLGPAIRPLVTRVCQPNDDQETAQD